MLSWLLHTHQENALDLERDKLTIRGRRVGNRCDVHIITPWPGRWKAEPFFDHPRLRYDWFFGSLFCIVAILPYRESEKPPEVSTEGNDNGCGFTISQNGFSDTILTAAQGKSIEFQDFKTDAEFAHVRIEEGRVRTHRLVAGTELTRSGKRLI